jgi:hypothetical protein
MSQLTLATDPFGGMTKWRAWCPTSEESTLSEAKQAQDSVCGQEEIFFIFSI